MLFKWKRILMFFTALHIWVLSSGQSNQDSTQSNVFKEYGICRFKFGSLAYADPDSTQELDIALSNFKTRKMPDLYIRISSYMCKEEAKNDPYIGVKRAKKVLEYLLKNLDFPADKFIIQDVDARYDNRWSNWGCDMDGVYVDIVKGYSR
jgi:hypothetical protein